MGGGKDQKQANQQLAQQHQYQSNQQQQFDTRNTADLNASRERGDQLYGDLYKGYNSLANAQPVAGGGGGGGGGYQLPGVDPRYNDVEAMYKSYMGGGGWEPDVKKAQQGRIDSLTEFGKTGGMTEEEKYRLRGQGNYEEFSKTGGLSDKDRANIRARGTSGIPAMYQQMADAQRRQQSIAGGYGPGGAVMAGRMARQQGAGMADAARNAELGIQEQVNQGRKWGTEGLTSSETALQDILSRNKLQGTQAANTAQQGMMDSIISGQKWGTEGEQGIANMYQGRADQQAQINASAAANSAANDRWAQEFNARQKLAGLEGLGSLYGGQGSGEYNVNKDFALQSAGGYGSAVGNAAMGQKTGNRSAWDTVGNIAGAVAGGMTGLGSIGSVAGMFGGGGGGMDLSQRPYGPGY